MTATTIFDLYRGRLNVWVEDDLTRVILTDLWQDRQIHVINAGGSEAVRYMVRAAANTPGLKDLVVGVIDRDFEDAGPDWALPDTRIFVLPAHEIENLLLDFEILGALAGRPGAELRSIAYSYVRDQRWWAVGKIILRELRKATTSGFPSDPPEGLAGAHALATWLAGQYYWSIHAEQSAWWSEPANRRHKIDELGTTLEQDLDSDAWLSRFPGKEILRHLRTHVASLDRTPPRAPSSSTERDTDLAKRITRKMVEEARAPKALATLREQLRRRVDRSA